MEWTFERFTKHAQNAMDLALNQARQRKHAFAGTEHLLLSLLADPLSPAIEKLLAPKGVTAAQVRGKLKELMDAFTYDAVMIDDVVLSHKLKDIVGHAYREAGKLRTNTVDVDCLFLALLHEGDAMGTKALKPFGFGIEEIRRCIVGHDGGWTQVGDTFVLRQTEPIGMEEGLSALRWLRDLHGVENISGMKVQ